MPFHIPFQMEGTLKSVRNVNKGDRFALHLSDGELESEVKKVSKTGSKLEN
jgi:exonuclease VII large subunit